MPRISNKSEKHICEFCKRSFSKELTLINHSCEKKRRWFSENHPDVRLAFMAWLRFYELNSRFTKTGEKKSFKDFINNRYYSAFVKFGKHLIALNVSDSVSFIDYVIKNNLPLDKWTHDIVYENYINDFLKKETPEKALTRTIELMKEWSSTYNEDWQNFFKKISPTLAASWIKSGKISPWVLYNADSANQLLDRCGPEQIQIISASAKPAQWKLKFIKYKEEADWIRNTLREVGI